RSLFIALLIIGSGIELSQRLLPLAGGFIMPNSLGLIWSAAYLMPIVVLLSVYSKADPAKRPRIVWLILSATLFAIGIFLSNWIPLAGQFSVIFEFIAYILALAGILYAVLRHQVVNVSFIISRALG